MNWLWSTWSVMRVNLRHRAVPDLVESERQRLADLPRAFELQTLTRRARAGQNCFAKLKLAGFPTLECGNHIAANLLDRFTKLPGIFCGFGGASSSVRARDERGIPNQAHTPECHVGYFAVVDDLDKWLSGANQRFSEWRRQHR